MVERIANYAGIGALLLYHYSRITLFQLFVRVDQYETVNKV